MPNYEIGNDVQIAKKLERFRSTAESLADHRPDLRSRYSHRGSFVAGDVPTRILSESNLEYQWDVTLLAQPDVAGLREQVRVKYRDQAEVERSHVFDILLKLKDGRRYFIAIKPAERAVATGLRALMLMIAPQVPRNLADGIIILTERRLSGAMVRDAELIHSARRDGSRPEDDAIMAAMAPVLGAVTVADLMTVSGLGGQGFRAIARLIGTGDLVLASPAPITHASRVARRGCAVNHRLGFAGIVSGNSRPSREGRMNPTDNGATP